MPNHLPRLPHHLFIFLIILVAVTLLVGTFSAFFPARAEAATSPTPTIIHNATPTATDFNPLNTTPTALPSLPAGIRSADTTGIIVQAIVLVAIVIFGTFWGWRMSHPRRPHTPRKIE